MAVGWRIFATIETGTGFIAQRWRWVCSEPGAHAKEAAQGFATLPYVQSGCDQARTGCRRTPEIDVRCPLYSAELLPCDGV